MSSVDNRIVRMEFQNSDFERNLQTSEESLKKFDSFLKSFGDSGVSSALDKISDKFSTLGIIGVTALQNITNQAIDTGKQLIKSLTTDNIASGWAKLENQTKAVGTLVSQGFDISEVNEQLDKLQWYTDETSYNFNDMLTAVSKFTAQGQSLSDSVSALEGIANWAAIAGQNATAGSSAMRELSQAVGVGYIRYQDWSSIQTLMMDYDGLRDMILESAVAMGTLRKNANDTYTSLLATTDQGATAFTKNQMASYLTTGKWFTTDVLMDVLNQFSEAVNPVYEYVQEHNVTAAEAIAALEGQISDVALGFFRAAQEARTFGDAIESVKEGVASGWQTTFGILVGDYEQQRELWTDLADRLYEVFVESGNARNEILKQWSELGGRDKLIQGLWNIFDGVIKIVNTVKTAWKSVFPSKTAKELMTLTEKFEAFTEKLIISDETAEKIGRTLRGVFSIFRLGRDAIYALIKPIASLMGSSNGLADSILTVSAHIGDTVANFVYMIETSDKLKVVSEAVSKVLSVLGIVIGAIGTGIGTVVKKVKDLTKNLSSPLKKAENKFESATTAVEGFISGLGFMKNKEENIVNITQAAEGLVAAFEDEEIVDAPEKLGKIGQAFKDLGTGIKSKYETYIKPAFDGIKNFLKTNIFNSDLVSGIIKLLGALVSIRFIWGIVDLVTILPSAMASIAKVFTSLSNILYGISLSIKGSGYLKYAAAIALVVGSLWVLTKLDFDKVWVALEIVKDVMSQLNEITLSSIASLWVLSKIDLTPFLISVGIIAAIIFAISELSPVLESFGISLKDAFSEENLDKFFGFINRVVGLANSLLASGAWIAMITFLSTLKTVTKAVKQFGTITVNVFKTDTSWAAKMLKFAASIGIIALSIIALGKMSHDEGFWTGIQVVLGIATFMSVATYALSYSTSSLPNTESIGKNLLGLAVGIGVISLAIKLLGSLNDEELDYATKGLLAIGVFVGALALIGEKTNGAKLGVTGGQLIAIGAAMIELAVGMVIFSAALKLISMAVESDNLFDVLASVAVGLIGMALALELVAKAIPDGRTAWNIIGIAFAFDMLAGALLVVSGAILTLANLEWYETISGAAAMFIALMGMGWALSTVAQAVKGLKTLGAVISLAGMVGVMYLLAKAFQEFEKIDSTALTGITIALSILIVVMGAFVTVIMAVAEACPVGGIIIVGVLALIALTCVAAGEAISKIIGAFESLAITIADRGPDIADGIKRISKSLTDGLVSMGYAISEFVVTVATSGAKAVVGFVMEFVNAYVENKDKLHEVASDLGWLILDGLTLGIAGDVKNGWETIKRGAKGFISKLKSAMEFGSPPPWSYTWGGWITEGLGDGMLENTVSIERAAEGIRNEVIDEFVTIGSDGASAFVTSLVDNVDLSPFDSSVSSALTELSVDGEAIESSKFFGMSLANANSERMMGMLEHSIYADVDENTASVLNSLATDSKSNWAAELWGKSMAEETANAYAEKTAKAFSVIDEFMANRQASQLQATGALLGILGGIDSEDTAYLSEVGLRTIEKNTNKVSKNVSSTLRKTVLADLHQIETDNPFDAWYSQTQQSNDELRSTNGILNDISKVNTNMLSDSKKSIEELRRKLKEIFSDAKDTNITPVLDDTALDNIQSSLDSRDYSINVKTNVDEAESNALEDWELSLDDLIRKYATLTHVYSPSDDAWHDYWAYNGPRSWTVDEETDYVYEGPEGGDYDPETKEFYALVGDELVNMTDWTQQMTDAYYGHTDVMAESIANNTSEITAALKDQTDQSSRYSEDILESLSNIGGKLDDQGDAIVDLSSHIDGLKLYLDDDTLVGGITDKIDSALGTKQKLVSQGVYR